VLPCQRIGSAASIYLRKKSIVVTLFVAGLLATNAL